MKIFRRLNVLAPLDGTPLRLPPEEEAGLLAVQVENGAEMIADLLGLVDRLLAERNGLVERVTALEAEMERRTGDS